LLKNEWWISLRASTKSTVDLTKILKHFGIGGGHAKAAGFVLYGKKGENIKDIFKPLSSRERFNTSIIEVKHKPTNVNNVLPNTITVDDVKTNHSLQLDITNSNTNTDALFNENINRPKFKQKNNIL
jgi:hypothetical protein